MLSAGGIRHQFSLQENIEMSMFTSEFLRTIREHLSVLGNSYIFGNTEENDRWYVGSQVNCSCIPTMESVPITTHSIV